MMSLSSSASRARIQLRLPITVLISPLWAMNRNGWASGQLGNVLVEKRECTTASAEATRSSTQVGEEVVELVGGQHALVGERAARQRREVDVGLVLGALAQAEGESLERHPGHARAGAGDEELDEARHHALGGGAQDVGVGRHLAPAEDGQALLGRDLLDLGLGLGQRVGVGGRTPYRRRSCRHRGARSRPRRAGTRRGPASGCPRRHRSWSRRPRRRGGRGCAARSGPWPRCRGWRRRSGWRRTPRRTRRARGEGRRALVPGGLQVVPKLLGLQAVRRRPSGRSPVVVRSREPSRTGVNGGDGDRQGTALARARRNLSPAERWQ